MLGKIAVNILVTKNRITCMTNLLSIVGQLDLHSYTPTARNVIRQTKEKIVNKTGFKI